MEGDTGEFRLTLLERCDAEHVLVRVERLELPDPVLFLWVGLGDGPDKCIMVAVEADVVMHIGLRIEDLANICEAVFTVVEDRLHILLRVTNANYRVIQEDWLESADGRVLEDEEVGVSRYKVCSMRAWERIDPIEDRVLELISVALTTNSVVQIELGALVIIKDKLEAPLLVVEDGFTKFLFVFNGCHFLHYAKLRK